MSDLNTWEDDGGAIAPEWHPVSSAARQAWIDGYSEEECREIDEEETLLERAKRAAKRLFHPDAYDSEGCYFERESL